MKMLATDESDVMTWLVRKEVSKEGEERPRKGLLRKSSVVSGASGLAAFYSLAYPRVVHIPGYHFLFL